MSFILQISSLSIACKSIKDRHYSGRLSYNLIISYCINLGYLHVFHGEKIFILGSDLMKFLSNFNTNLADELYNSSTQKYGPSKVLVVRRDSIFLWFKVIIPSVGRITLLIGLIIAENQLIFSSYPVSISWGGAILIIIATIVWIIRTISRLIDYTMDFCIITPVQVLANDQCGIFNRTSRSLDLSNLKSIDIEKNGLIKSFFNFGTVIFFSEGDSMNPHDQDKMGTIRLNYIKDPSQVIHNIMNVIKHTDEFLGKRIQNQSPPLQSNEE